MARINKNTRIKGLPVRVQQQEKDNAPGTYPEERVVQTGEQLVWNDESTIIFTGSSDVNYASKLSGDSPFLSTELSTSLSTTGKIVAGISDTFVTSSVKLTPYQPFRDSANFASDGKSEGSRFFATGTLITDGGEGFTSPLWSKKKIEIDISSNPCSFKYVISQSLTSDTTTTTTASYPSGSSYPMAYFNFQTRMWEGIGTGWPGYDNNIEEPPQTQAVLDAANFATYGFHPSIITLGRGDVVNQITSSDASIAATASFAMSQKYPYGLFREQKAAGEFSSLYGFPYDGKFHATSSQLYTPDITEPFLIEKVVVEVSGASFTMFDSIDNGGVYNITGAVLPACINNFFILNQKKNTTFKGVAIPYPEVTDARRQFVLPQNVRLTSGSAPTKIDTYRELLTYGGVTAHTLDLPDEDFNLELMPISDTLQLSPFSTPPTIDLNRWRWRGAYAAEPLTEAQRNQFYVSGALTSSMNPLENMTRDMLISLPSSISNSLSALSWDKTVRMELKATSPLKNFSSLSFGQQFNGLSLVNAFGGRTGLGIELPSPSSKNNELQDTIGRRYPSIPRAISGVFVYDLGGPPSQIDSFNLMTVVDEWKKPNPYILMPGDSLIIGWQLPLLDRYVTDTVDEYNNWLSLSVPPSGSNRLVDICEMSFNGAGKIVLYGSSLSAGKESNRTLNQPLTSNAVHGVIK